MARPVRQQRSVHVLCSGLGWGSLSLVGECLLLLQNLLMRLHRRPHEVLPQRMRLEELLPLAYGRETNMSRQTCWITAMSSSGAPYIESPGS